MNITVNKVKDFITGTIGSTKYSVKYTEQLFKALQEVEEKVSSASTMEEVNALLEEAVLLTKRNFNQELTEIIPYLSYNDKSQKYYLTQNGKTSSIPMPKVLVDRMMKAHEENTPIIPFVKAWTWFLRNPKFSLDKAERFARYITTLVVDQEEKSKLMEEGYSDSVATQMATYNDVSITKNGLISTYKYVTIKDWKFDEHGKQIERYKKLYNEENGTYIEVDKPVKGETPLEDWYLLPPVMMERGEPCLVSYQSEPTHRVKVGGIHALASWNSVNCNDNASCVPGLHLGGLTYIKGYGGKTELLLNCFVNPMHIGAFDHSGNGAIRCLEYFVHSGSFAPNKNLYHESDYAKRGEDQWAQLRAEAIENSEKAIQALKEKVDEISAF
jgi:hypothetical protein